MGAARKETEMRIVPFSRLLQLASPFLLGVALAGGVATTTTVAHAQDAEVEISVQPPVDRVEVIPPAPSPNHFWIHGFWGWNGTAHFWNPGRYEVMRPGWGWTEARWGAVGPRWHYWPGRWVRR